MSRHLLDQTSSQALARLAAERGLAAAVSPIGEEAVRKPGRGWKRWLPYLFFGLSLFALGGMTLGITALAEDGWSWGDATQLALMAILVVGVVSQARSMIRPTRVGRWFAAKLGGKPGGAGEGMRIRVYPLDAVSAEYLTAISPASAASMKTRTAVRRAGSRWFDRGSVVAVVVLAVLAFLGMLFILGWMVYAAGPTDPSVWLTAPFTGLTGFALWQLLGSARKMSFRGRPWALVSRAFRDTVRVWGSGSVATKVALTTTATASVAGAAVVPSIVDRDTLYDVFVIDSASAAIYRVDLQTDLSTQPRKRDTDAARPIAILTSSTPVTTAEGRKLPKGSLYVVLSQGRGQAIAGLGPAGTQPVAVSRIEPPIPDAWFTGGPGTIYAVQPDGAYWQVDIRSGIATRVGQVTVPPGPIAYEPASKTLVMVSGTGTARLETGSGALLSSTPNAFPAGMKVCGIADGPDDLFFLSVEGQPEILVIKPAGRASELLRPQGEAAASPCQLAVAIRK